MYIILTPHEYYMVLPALAINGLLIPPFTLHSQNCSMLPGTVPSGRVNGSFLSRTVPFWKGSAIDSRTVLELFRVSVNAINSGTVPTHA